LTCHVRQPLARKAPCALRPLRTLRGRTSATGRACGRLDYFFPRDGSHDVFRGCQLWHPAALRHPDPPCEQAQRGCTVQT
ncbi:unnamed protein product, partial [Polarella glacialis]